MSLPPETIDDAEVERVRTAMGIGTKFVPVATFAKAGNVCEHTVRALFERGILTRHRLGNTVYVDVAEAAAALAAGARAPKSETMPARRPGRPVGSTKAKAAAQREAASSAAANTRNGLAGTR